MIRRGRILRDTTAGPGLLVVDDTQLLFTLERMWTSAGPPARGMVVDVEVNGSNVVSVAPVRRAQLAREQAERAFASARQGGAALAHGAVARFGLPALVAGATLVVGWFFLAAASLTTPLGRIDFTFWQVLAAVNTGGEAMMQRMAGISSPGIYGILAALALAGPFVRPFCNDRRAHLGGVLPLLLMLVVAWKALHLGDPSGKDTTGLASANPTFVQSVARDVRDEIWRSISLGFGAYVSAAAAAYVALVSVRRYLAATAGPA